MAKHTLETIKEKLKEINSNIEILSKEYINNSTKLKCKCLIDGYEWGVTWGHLSQGRGCPECAGKRTDYTIKDIREKLYKINPNIEILSDEYVGSGEKLKCKCLIDGYVWEPTWDNLKQGKGCHKCKAKKSADFQRLSIEEVKNRLEYINPNVKILSEEYIHTREKLKCKCVINGCEWKTTWDSLSQGHGCPICNSSKGEKIILEILLTKNIPHERQYAFKDCKNKHSLAFDFAILDSCDNVVSLIEYDGEQHFKPIDFASRGEEWAIKQHIGVIKRDEIKNTYCKENNIPLLRIPYTEFDNIENILDEWLLNRLSDKKCQQKGDACDK